MKKMKIKKIWEEPIGNKVSLSLIWCHCTNTLYRPVHLNFSVFPPIFFSILIFLSFLPSGASFHFIFSAWSLDSLYHCLCCSKVQSISTNSRVSVWEKTTPFVGVLFLSYHHKLTNRSPFRWCANEKWENHFNSCIPIFFSLISS